MRKLIYLAALLMLSVGTPVFADQIFLEEPKMVAVGNEGEIRIALSTEIRYVRHFPESLGDTLRIFVEVADPCVAEEIVMQESRWLPQADWFVPFTVSFPELIGRDAGGGTVCQTTHNKVDVAKTLLIKFKQPTKFKVRPGPDNHSIVVVVPLLKPQQEVPAAKLPPADAAPASQQQPRPAEAAAQGMGPQPDANAQAEAPGAGMAPPDLLMAGRAALAAGDAIKAIQLFNQLLNLPPNDYSQEAQELVGVAREQAGELDKALAEYQLYIKLYPDGEGAARVKQRLAALQGAMNQPKQVKTPDGPKKPVKEIHQNIFTGSLSQYYYAGKTQSTTDSSGVTTKARSIDQSTLITNVDATERMRHNQYDTKIVFRDTQTHNALPGMIDKNTVSSAYIEHENRVDNYMFRLGRQSGTSQGVLGRFDGIFARYGFNSQWKLAVVAGVPDNGSQNKVETDRHFYGAAVEFGPLAEKWSGSVYGIQQVADDIVERRAVGTEVRYFNGTTSWFGLMDYDTIYDMVNIAMLQGNWMTAGGYNFNFLLDHRKSPILYGETAIAGADPAKGARSVGDLSDQLGLSNHDIYSYVRGLTPDSDMAMLGVTKQVTQRWQLGGDARVTHTSAAEGTPFAIRQPGTKNIYTYTLQAIGTNTLFKDDTSVIMASLVDDPHYDGQNLSFSNSLTLREKWRVDTSLRYYRERRDTDASSWIVTPSIRLNYHWRDNMTFEAELHVDRTHTDDPVSATKFDSWRETLFAGYRWDFR